MIFPGTVGATTGHVVVAGGLVEAVAPANIYDVAVRAGVSASTVSRSMRGHSRVAPETRRRIEQAAQDLAWTASPQAAGLASGRTATIGVVVPFVTRWFFSTIVSGVTDALRDSGFDVLLYQLGSAGDRDRFFARMPLARRVDGVLTCSLPLTEEHTLALRALDLPHVSVGPPVPGVASVGIDEAGAVRAAVNHLVHQGHTRIGYLAGVPDDPGFGFLSAPARRAGFEAAMQAVGLSLDPRCCAAGPYGVGGGATAMAALLAGPVLPTALVAEYDELAMGALLTLRRAGLQVPRDISVVGVDDHAMAEVLDLSTVGQDVHRQGVLGAELLLRRLRGEESRPGAELLVPTRLVLRGSTAPPGRENVS